MSRSSHVTWQPTDDEVLAMEDLFAFDGWVFRKVFVVVGNFGTYTPEN